MRGALRVFAKDVFELFHGLRGIALVLVLPPLLLVLVGQLRSQSFPFRVLVAGAPHDTMTGASAESVRAALRLVGELSSLDVTAQAAPVTNPLATMRAGGWDLLVDAGCDQRRCLGPTAWRLYTAETDPSRLAVLKPLVATLERTLAADKITSESTEPLLERRLEMVAAVPPRSLFVYYPLVEDRSYWLLPMTIALIVCFLPFALAVSTLIREKEAHTLEILLAAPGIRPSTLFAGKCLLPVAVTLFDLLVMLLVVQTVYRVHLKPGVLELAMFVLPAALAATLLGLLVSAAATSQSQALLASAIYFLALTLITGFLLPIGEGSELIRRLSRLLPLTFVLPALRAWMFGAHPLPSFMQGLAWLLMQCAVCGVLAALAFRQALRRI